jgi:hypothetical protein
MEWKLLNQTTGGPGHRKNEFVLIICIGKPGKKALNLKLQRDESLWMLYTTVKYNAWLQKWNLIGPL